MEIENRKSISDSLKIYTFIDNEDDFIEVTEWTNGEGIDITISRVKGDSKMISLHYDELEAINYLSKSLVYKK